VVFNDHPDASGTIWGVGGKGEESTTQGGNTGISPASRFRILSSRAKHYERKFVVQNNMQNTVSPIYRVLHNSPEVPEFASCVM